MNSFDEFLMFYIAAGFVIGLLWAILEADIVLGPLDSLPKRRRRYQRLSPLLALLGVVHLAFALVAVDLTRADESDRPSSEPARRRLAALARAGALGGTLMLALACAPHIPALDAMPGLTALEQAIPWE